ncbi:16S rRNA (cytosine1402-N4)-methyltransferase [Ekhidna lutea]|uniref:Ribosomal RNA small subunit methyltransferase H n=1 Tax=Ekhidna lutea TaxID=447679 RepID=A0A239L2G6_EKHLU|nr:16S rRNA (cytosine(1402)-N(4))-methyltransferase RsmH [Ekhidna lutea]SNT24023.1 16S rRNA (cytosine1402-N4)-methyltransferase [Ekhidna lutea]
MSEYHNPVMLQECLDGLDIKPDGVYVDVTFGGGGHSKAILDKLTTGHLIAFDQDKDAEQNATKLAELLEKGEPPFSSGRRVGDEGQAKRSFTFIESNFRYLKKYLRLHGITEVDGILADLGVSSHQFDEPERGFTIRAEGELDMRMDQAAAKSAREVVNEYEEKDLIHILSAYGEIRNARTLAREIVSFRMNQPIETNEQLKAIAMKNAPKGRDLKYLAQVFQAIRIEVNDEMDALREFLVQAGEVLKAEGRLVVMSYHSLEDRPVKNFINKGNIKGVDEKDFYGNPIRVLDPVNRKPIIPTAAEIKENSRARSAKLRIGKKRSVK